jgi:preprotein translocase subunit SecF
MPSFAQFGNDLYSGRRSFDFVGRTRLWYGIAAALLLISAGALVFRGLNPGIEFRGGSEFEISQVKDRSEITGQKAVSDAVAGTEARVSKLGDDNVRVQTSKLDDRSTQKVAAALAAAYKVPVGNVSSSFVGPSWGEDVSNKALVGLVVFLALVVVTISLYFRTWTMAVSGLVALLHDLVITVGVYALVGWEVTPASVIGFLTILGYSLYDTVVVFDKVRENTAHIEGSTKRTYAEAANLAVNQTLVRSINTSVVALLPVSSILFIGAFLLGAGTLKDISLALFVGIAVGTYSSIFIATPLLVQIRMREPGMRAQAERVRKRRLKDGQEPALVGVGAGPVGDEGHAGAESLAGTSVADSQWSEGGRGAADAPRVDPRRAAVGGTGGQRAQPRRNKPGTRGR